MDIGQELLRPYNDRGGEDCGELVQSGGYREKWGRSKVIPRGVRTGSDMRFRGLGGDMRGWGDKGW